MEPIIRCPRCERDVDGADATCAACGQFLAEQALCARHPTRRAEGVCVVCGDPVCDDCDPTDEVHYTCPNHRTVPVIEGWAQIYTTSDTVEADLIKENLVSEGLDAAVLSQKDHSFTVDLGDLSSVRILVPAYEYLDAMQVIATHMDVSGELVFACPTCGEAFEAGDTICGMCGAALPTSA
jgi:uncharacterized C2H2 Zn-finger protein